MYITQIDDLFDNLLDKLNEYLIKNKMLDKITKDTNFVKYQNQIMDILKDFINKTISKKTILDIIKNEVYYEYILETMKRYCAFYIYLGIAYYYTGGRDLFITNIIESSKNQKDSTFQIANFYNSENNSKLINFFNDIKNIQTLIQVGKTMERIKIVLDNDKLKFDSTIKLFSDLGEDYITEHFLSKDNFHIILKTLIFKQIYLKEEQNDIMKFLNQEEKQAGEYMYIEIIKSNEKKLIDFSLIQKFLTLQELKVGLANEIYDYLVEMRDTKEFILRENKEFINFLFSKGVLIPITEEFLRYHDNNEKYESGSASGVINKDRDSTKIKYIVSKLNNIRNFYSPLLEKNPKLKLETEKMFHKAQEVRKVVLYNENEELKIVQKLKNSENATDHDLLIELENMRKYSFVNFKNPSRDSFKLRTLKTIDAIRSISLQKKKNENLETRIGHDNLDMTVIGVGWNPSENPLDCFKSEDLIDVNKLNKDKDKENGFNSFTKTMKNTFDKENKKLYYWLFDIKKDIPKLSTYNEYNKNDPAKNIKLMIAEIYKNYINMVKNKYEIYIKTLDEITIWNLDNILKGYAKKYFDFNLNPEIKNLLIEQTLNKLKEIEITIDDVDEMMPGKRDTIIELPILKREKEAKNIILINFEEEEEIILDKSINEPLCLHYVKWRNINKLSKTNADDFSQSIVDFAKQYVKISKSGDYVCKSCNEMLYLQKFIYEGTYVEELDTFMTTNIAVNQRLEEIPKYVKFMRTIRNLEKNIEKIAYSSDLNVYLGTSPTIRLKRKLIIKDVLDLILLHTEYLKKQPKSRIEDATVKYNISKEFTNLFFFELKDEIFLTSSTDTDYYKLIKYNNVISYLLFIIILELNPGQLLNLKDDKRCNYFFFDRFGKPLFEKLFLRKNQKEKILISKYPLLCYAIYYFACVFTNNRIWLWNDSSNINTETDKSKNKIIDAKNKQITIINVQKTIVNTIVDLINSIVEANFIPEINKEDQTNKDKEDKFGKKIEKNFLYDFINIRFTQKLNTTFNDLDLLKRIEGISIKKINIDEQTKKISFIVKKSHLVDIPIDIDLMQDSKDRCDVAISEFDHLENLVNNNYYDIITNCSDGKFHKWKFDKNDMTCSLCNQSYTELVKLYSVTSSAEDENKIYLQKLRLINLNKLAKKYCISGEFHELNDEGTCIKCKKNPATNKFTEKDLEKMDKNIEEKTYESNLESFKLMKKFLNDKEEEKNKIKFIIDKFNKSYIEQTENKLYSYVSDFIDRMIKILGAKIKIKDNIIYLKETIYTLDHDYLGNTRKEIVYILSSDQKIETYKNHPYYKIDVIYYKDKANNVFVYYDLITLQYLGYSENNKDFKKTKSNATIKINLSVKDSIMLLGLENKYINLYHLNSSYQKMKSKEILENSYFIINNYIRTRVSNLKQIVSRSLSIINNIKNNGRFISLYGSEEKALIDNFIKKIKHFKIDKDGKDSIFENWKIISNNVGINTIPENIEINIIKNYFDTGSLPQMNNTDSKIIYFLIENLNKLLDYNSQVAIQSEICNLIIQLIQFSFNQYFRPYSNTQVRKFDYILINETPYIDDNLKVVGFYQELLNNKEIDDKKDKEKNDNYDAQQAFESMDIDDYEINEDFDESMEALDNSGE